METYKAQDKEHLVSLVVPGRQGDHVTDPTLASAHGRRIGVVAATMADHSFGMIRHTGRTLDVALEGDGFLVVQTARGERYTRAGALKLNADSQLVTQQGDLVVGEEGPITVPQGEVLISENGDLSVDGTLAGRLKLVRFDNLKDALFKEGESLFDATGAQGRPPSRATSTRVVQNALEMSNVDTITEMAAMIQNSREFDSLQRSVTMLMNDLGRKVASEIGRI